MTRSTLPPAALLAAATALACCGGAGGGAQRAANPRVATTAASASRDAPPTSVPAQALTPARIYGHAAIALSSDGVACFSADDRWLAVGDDSGLVRVLDAASGTPMAALRGHEVAITLLEAAPSGALVSGDAAGELVLWSAGPHGWLDAEPMRLASRHRAAITSVSLSADGRVMVTADRDGNALAWDMSGPIVTKQLDESEDSGDGVVVGRGAASHYAVASDGKRALGWGASFVFVVSLADGERRPSRRVRGTVLGAEGAGEGFTVTMRDRFGSTVREILDRGGNALRRESGASPAEERVGHRAARFTPELLVVGPAPVQVIRRRDGALLRRGGEGGSIDGFALGVIEGRFVVSAESGEYRNRISLLGAVPHEDRSDDAAFGLGNRLAFSPDGRLLANAVGELELLATATAATTRTMKLHADSDSESYDDVEAMAFAEEGTSVLLGYESGFIEVRPLAIQAPTSKELAPGVKRGSLPVLADLATATGAVGPRDITARAIAEPSRTVELPGRALAMAFDGRTILLSNNSYDAALYHVASAKAERLSLEPGRVEAGPAGSYVVNRGYGEPATIVGRGAPLPVKESCRDALSVAEGAYFCATYREMTVEGSRSGHKKLDRGTSILHATADAQGDRIALATAERVVLRSATTLEPLGTVAIPSADWLAFSGDGRRLVVVGNEVAVVVDAATGKVLRLFEGHDARRALLSADGHRLVTIGSDDVRLWNAETGAVIARIDTGPVGDAVGLCPDGRTLLVADRWELTEWRVP